MKIDIHDYYNMLESEKIMLSFKGDLSNDLITAIVEVVENKIVSFNAELKIKKKVINVLIECLQNLYHHNKEAEANLDPSIMVLIAKNKDGYSVFTGNNIQNSNIEKLKARLEEISDLSTQELKILYQQKLANGQFSEKGGGGLGIIDIARKSKSKLEYGFASIDESSSFFSLNVNINN
ncbi:MAG: hypothetical protein ACI8XB_000071 [Patiriisocius sp.]|jgi:hypothetical protein